MTAPSFQDFKNEVNRAKWTWRWALQGGSRFWVARDLKDLRTEGEREMWRRLEVKIRHTPRFKRRKVVNLTHERFERERRRQTASRAVHARTLGAGTDGSAA